MVSLQNLHSPGLWPVSAERLTRWPFFWLCAYVLSQVFTIPVIAKGPWPVWMTLSDLASVGLVCSLLPLWSRLPVVSRGAERFGYLLLLAGAGCCTSFLLFIVAPLLLDPRAQGTHDALLSGAVYLVRFAQFIGICLCALRIPLSPARRQWLTTLVTGTFIVVCTGIIITYFNVIPAQTFVAHLPLEENAHSPWYTFGVERASALGMVGFNHGYVALQVLGLAMLTLHLRGGGRRWVDALLIFLMVAAVFMSGSRVGLVAGLVFAGVVLLRRPLFLLPVIGAVLAVMLLIPEQLSEYLVPALQRQSTIMTPEETGGLAGRDVIWDDTLTFLREQPHMIVTGAGLGALRGENAHNQYMQFIAELGLLGLLVFLALTWRVLRFARNHEAGIQPIFWGTIALLISAVTQETFYPVVAFGHFLGLYLVTVAILFNTPSTLCAEESSVCG